jgi:hypothetical protein
LNNTQQRVKQLESRLQVTEVSNRALLEEVIRLQNELALSLRKSFETIAEERSARQLLENNYRSQLENVLQLNGRLKRAEDSLQEDRTAMQSLILLTKNLENVTSSAQKDLFVRRDFQAQRLEDLRLQIDDLQRSKENLERNAFGLLEEIKNIKSRVDMEALNLNTVSGDLRNKTRRLEDENRQHVISFLFLFLSSYFSLFSNLKLNSKFNLLKSTLLNKKNVKHQQKVSFQIRISMWLSFKKKKKIKKLSMFPCQIVYFCRLLITFVRLFTPQICI